MMKTAMRSLKVAFIATLLTGCNSFNTIHDHRSFEQEHLSHQLPAEPPSVASSVPDEARTKLLCPKFALPDLGKTPELPLKQLRQIKAGDNAALDALVQSHIRELRAYIGTTKMTIYARHSEYLKSCKSVSVR